MGFSRQEYWSGLPFPFMVAKQIPGLKEVIHMVHVTGFKSSHYLISLYEQTSASSPQTVTASITASLALQVSASLKILTCYPTGLSLSQGFAASVVH